MSAAAPETWSEGNRRCLLAGLEWVRDALRAHAEGRAAGTDREALDTAEKDLDAPSTLAALSGTFGLSRFEEGILLLCAGMELDGEFSGLCAAASGDRQRTYPTFSLALAVLPEAHWSALTPDAPLRRWRLLEVGAGPALTLSPLRIDERILHYLAGTPHPDERLSGLVQPARVPTSLVPSHAEIAARVTGAWTTARRELPVVQLCGDDPSAKRGIAAAACGCAGLGLSVLRADLIPSAPAELEDLARLWEREAVLIRCGLLLDCDALDGTDTARWALVTRLAERLPGEVLLSVRDRRVGSDRSVLSWDVGQPTPEEQRSAWTASLGAEGAELNGQLDQLVAQFNLGAGAIASACAQARGAASDLGGVLWDTCRVQARARLDDLAQRIEPSAGWDDLVLPEGQKGLLRDLATHVRQRARVYESWGFAGKGRRGLGISALFAGTSGTGKTLAAEVVAGALRLDLYRIDLSQVVSKYIGETEKNLRRVFDAAEAGGAVLLFDEADALFGKRSEVRDSHDRYANIEVSYLLQRMEAYRGLAILTTNLKGSLDTAFLRRLRFVIEFPFPDAAQRAEIWRRVFPTATPTEGLDPLRLARLNVAGGSIRNIALGAAFLAADAGEPVRMRHLLRSARSEYAKLEKPLSEMEVAGWV